MEFLEKHRNLLNPLLLTVGLYCFFTFLIQPFDKYIISDEWSSLRQIEAFSQGIWRINGAKDTSFILQGLLGTGINLIVKDYFISIRILNFLNTLGFLLGIYLIFNMESKEKKVNFLNLGTLLFNPLTFFISFTFLSEMYFLTFLVWTMFFYLKYLESKKTIFLAAAGLISSGSILIRQQGVFLAGAIILSLLFSTSDRFIIKKPDKKTLTNILLVSVLGFAGLLLYGLWPRYINWENEYLFSGFAKLLNKKNVGAQFFTQIYSYLYSYFYFSLFLGPVLVIKKLKGLVLWLAILVFSGLIYYFDVFYLGNILYLEGIYAKSSHTIFISFFNNPIFKFFLSLVTGYLSVQLFLNLKTIIKNFKLNTKENIFLSILFVSLFVSNFYVIDVYDRYVLPTLVVLGLFILINRDLLKDPSGSNNKFGKQFNYVVFFMLVIMGLFTTFEYINFKKTAFDLAQKLHKNIKPTRIYLDDEYGKYYKSKQANDFTGLIYPHPEDCCKCYIVREYKPSISEKTLQRFNSVNPQIRNYTGLDRKIKDLETGEVDIVYQTKLLDPTHNLIGTKSLLNVYCEKDYQPWFTKTK